MVGIAAIEYVLPGEPVHISALERQGRLESGAASLQSFGFEWAYVSSRPAEELALEAATRLLCGSQAPPESVDALFYASATAGGHALGARGLERFSYPAARLQYELELLNATAVGISQAGCLGLTTAVQAAADFLAAHPAASRALCVSADVLPSDCPREVIFNLISDGACAVLVEKGTERNRLLAHCQVTKGYYWDCVARREEIIAAYFPTAQNLLGAFLDQQGITRDELAWVIPHNVSLRSWQLLARLACFPEEKVFTANIAAKGHVIAGDNWINLKDATCGGRLQPGDKLLLFNFGFGANWSCTLLEH